MTKHIRPIAIAIIRRGNEILVFKDYDHERDLHYCRPLGGGVEFMELAEDALKREFIEELGEPINDIRFLKVFENIFQFRGKQHHEMVFVYEASFANPSAYTRNDLKIIDDDSVEVHWIGIEKFKSNELALFPQGLLQLV